MSFILLIKAHSIRRLSAVGALLLWTSAVLVSIPWLSLILFISFLRTRRRDRVSLANAWARFILSKVAALHTHSLSRRSSSA